MHRLFKKIFLNFNFFYQFLQKITKIKEKKTFFQKIFCRFEFLQILPKLSLVSTLKYIKLKSMSL
ncbi:hypothetical protein BpHYR1_016541 [Brachionus plicatilis]|uniref:Uncharacterized protein n=1 Tax=Brachionus plicatilis TaxID=10195 RepID=A0A3M7PSF6_BRAPC|nr:hypothetical protein BpHYR1_016541 [Brachionus plicatilis]